MSVFGVWACRESDRLVAGGKLDIEPSDESMNEIASSRHHLERCFECEVGRFNGIEIDCHNSSWISNTGLCLHSVDKRFAQGSVFQWREVESIDVVPDYAQRQIPFHR